MRGTLNPRGVLSSEGRSEGHLTRGAFKIGLTCDRSDKLLAHTSTADA
jgi:hypothetical protein